MLHFGFVKVLNKNIIWIMKYFFGLIFDTKFDHPMRRFFFYLNVNKLQRSSTISEHKKMLITSYLIECKKF